MAYNSKYTGQEVENLLDQIANGEIGNGITSESDPIFSASPAASITEAKKTEWDNKVDKVSGKQLSTEDFTSTLKSKLEGLSNYDDTELSNAISTLRGDLDKLVSGDTTTAIKTFNEVIAFLDGIQDTQDLSSIIASIEQQIGGKQDAISDLDEIRSGAAKGATALQPGDIPNSAEPMVCAYTIGSYTTRTIALVNHTYNGQTMDYREGAIISVLNPNSADVVFEGGIITLDGNEYEAAAFTLKVGATALFALGPDPGVLLPISSVVGTTTTNNKLPLEDTAITLEGNVLSGNVYVIPNAIASLSVDIAEPTDGVLVKDYIIHFFTGASVSSFSFPDEMLWANGNVPTIEESTAYELSVVATTISGNYVYKAVLTPFKLVES